MIQFCEEPMLLRDTMGSNRLLRMERDNLYGNPTFPIIRFRGIALSVDHRLYTVRQELLLKAQVKL